jgi:hypothetical protein
MQMAFLKFFLASPALAQTISSIPDKNWGQTLTILTFLAALVALGLVTVFSRLDRRTAKHATNLFLKISYLVGNSTNLMTGYLRSLGLDHATFVTQEACVRGDRVHLVLDSLPNFPERNFRLEAEVTGARFLRGDKNNRLVHVKFNPSSIGPETSLSYYLKILNR